MPDNIERFADGTAAFAGFREPAWHRLGEVFQERANTEQVLAKALPPQEPENAGPSQPAVD